MKTKAAVQFTLDGPLELVDLEVPDPSENQVIVKMYSSGVCHSQLHQMANPNLPRPLVLGHEGTGIVTKTGKNVAIIGSGPAGLAAAQLINRAGHNTTVFERSTKPGGLLRFGIPDFKLEKNIVDQRIYQMEDEGVLFKNGINVGYDISGSELLQEFDAICLTGGSTVPRDLDVPGRDLDGIHFAMEFLVQQNKSLKSSFNCFNGMPFTSL